jgi:hypothetical protein
MNRRFLVVIGALLAAAIPGLAEAHSRDHRHGAYRHHYHRGHVAHHPHHRYVYGYAVGGHAGGQIFEPYLYIHAPSVYLPPNVPTFWERVQTGISPSSTPTSSGFQ